MDKDAYEKDLCAYGLFSVDVRRAAHKGVYFCFTT